MWASDMALQKSEESMNFNLDREAGGKCMQTNFGGHGPEIAETKKYRIDGIFRGVKFS